MISPNSIENEIFRKFIHGGIGRVFAILTQILITFLSAYILGVESYSEYLLLISLSTLVGSFANAWGSAAQNSFIATKEEKRRKINTILVYGSLILSFLSYCITYLLLELKVLDLEVASILNSTPILMKLALGATIVMLSLQSTQTVILTTVGSTLELAKSQNISKLITLVFLLLCWSLPLKYSGLELYIYIYFPSTLPAMLTCLRNSNLFIDKSELSETFLIFKRFITFSGINFNANLIKVLELEILSRFGGAALVAVVGLTQRIVSPFSSSIVAGFRNLWPVVMNARGDEMLSALSAARKLKMCLVIFSIFLGILVYALSPTIQTITEVPLLNYPIMPLYIIAYLFHTAVSSFAFNIFAATKNQYKTLIILFGQLLLLVMLIMYAIQIKIDILLCLILYFLTIASVILVVYDKSQYHNK